MSILVLCNLGARDVLLEGECPPLAPTRDRGQRLLANYDDITPGLRFPIIEPCLRYILGRQREEVDLLLQDVRDQARVRR